jgi:hypothetical protein
VRKVSPMETAAELTADPQTGIDRAPAQARRGHLLEVIARYVEALGGRLDLVAHFGDGTLRLPVSDPATAA